MTWLLMAHGYKYAKKKKLDQKVKRKAEALAKRSKKNPRHKKGKSRKGGKHR